MSIVGTTACVSPAIAPPYEAAALELTPLFHSFKFAWDLAEFPPIAKGSASPAEINGIFFG
jgi:hypothetical protein